MATSIIFGVLLILLETNTISGTCTEFVNGPINNVSMEFNFTWVNSEIKHVRCFNGSGKIGECYDLSGFKCPLDSTSSGVYTMSVNADLTAVNVTIITSDNITSGNYSCSKSSGNGTITKCVQNSVSTTSPTTTTATTSTTPKPLECTVARSVGRFGAVGFVASICVILLLMICCRCCHQICRNDCCTTKRKCLLAVLVLGVILVIIAIAIAESETQCDEGWTVQIISAIVVGSIGNVLLCIIILALAVCMYKLNSEVPPSRDLCCDNVCMCESEGELTPSLNLRGYKKKDEVEPMPMPVGDKSHLVKDLHHGLVFSHISGFMGFAVKDLKNQLLKQLEKYDNQGKQLIEIFLLVIPENCTMVLPTKSDKKFGQLQYAEEFSFHVGGNKDVYTVTIFKLIMQHKEYYICAQVPTVLTVISQLPEELTGKINVFRESQTFKQLYQEILNVKEWNNTVQLVTCQGKDDIALALFKAASGFVGENNQHDCQQISNGTLPTVDVIPGLAWDYVHNYLIKKLSNELRQKYLNMLSIDCKCIEKLIIVWVKSCKYDKCWTELANKGTVRRHVGPLTEDQTSHIADPQTGQPLKLNFFKFTDTDDKRCFLAEFCTPMQCIKMMESDYKGMSSAAMEEQGPRFKNIFDQIMLIPTVRKKLGDVSFIFFDDVSGYSGKSLIDLLAAEIMTAT